MWRAFFLAIGTYLVLLGAQCLGVEKFILKPQGQAPKAQVAAAAPAAPRTAGSKKEITPAPWAPWSLMGAGAVICLYSFTLPVRLKSG